MNALRVARDMISGSMDKMRIGVKAMPRLSEEMSELRSTISRLMPNFQMKPQVSSKPPTHPPQKSITLEDNAVLALKNYSLTQQNEDLMKQLYHSIPKKEHDEIVSELNQKIEDLRSENEHILSKANTSLTLYEIQQLAGLKDYQKMKDELVSLQNQIVVMQSGRLQGIHIDWRLKLRNWIDWSKKIMLTGIVIKSLPTMYKISAGLVALLVWLRFK